ncbi:hypothetical protein DESUT3_32120 [Desulfuromonas versatilis]|uniref:Uncharacterized protein n=1 Tax=Desulfuromonas versatilis TaxID=2802975 RepID=A0ABM8HZL9_9BACT|nr:hypothetical protein [Desulfuromonas versatilis]BCR06143.1 hypothetical protein DESUT3_32120 [Desulfuromonas versatilis]
MPEFGLQHLAMLAVLLLVIYGVIMTIDAIRRPGRQFKVGSKSFWIILLVISNPFISRYFGSQFLLPGLVVFLAASIGYHVVNLWKNPVSRGKKNSSGR